MNNLIPVVYALKDNHMVHVDTVPTGKDCGCYCDACKEPLIAKNKGPLRQHHFAHRHDSDCKSGYQTQLHLLAKEIFLEAKEFELPAMKYERKPLLNSKLFSSKKITIKNVQLEKCINNFIPDIVITDENDELYFVEIKVTHEVDSIKLEKIKLLNVSCIEIDLSGYILESKEELKERLFHHKELYKWIYFKDQDLIQKKMNEATEVIELVNFEKQKSPVYCPKRHIKIGSYRTADFVDHCQQCPFNLGVSNFEDRVVCGGKLEISNYNDLEKYKSVKKTDNQIKAAIKKSGYYMNFSVSPDFKPKPIKEWWNGSPILVRNITNNLCYLVIKDPNITLKKNRYIFGHLYENYKQLGKNITIYNHNRPIWVIIPKTKKTNNLNFY